MSGRGRMWSSKRFGIWVRSESGKRLMTSDQRRVKVSRGPRLKLEPHPESCDLADVRTYASRSSRPLAVDLFCCGGGLSLGLEEAGFRVLLGVDRDEFATETHRAHFGGVSLRADLSDKQVTSDIADALEGINISLVAGSPPCQPFSRAGGSKIRSLVQKGIREPEDERKELWEGFLSVVERLSPPTVLMENVPDLVAGNNSIVFRQIVDALEGQGYDIHTRILPCWQFGVPQHRQRLFIVGVRRGTPFKWPRTRFSNPPGVGEAISDLPPIESGVGNDGLPYARPDDCPSTALQRWARRGQPRGRGGKIYDHISRPVRPDDLEAFRLMKPHMRYSALPAHPRRYRTDHFDDKYNRLDVMEPSRTITAHIARDGYWYIHPTEDRTLSVREAARIQTFPDRFRFAGTPSHAFRQIGEAVPPLVGRALGKALIRSLRSRGSRSYTIRTGEVSKKLLKWVDRLPEAEFQSPWREGMDLWRVLMGMVIFKRLPTRVAATTWPVYRDRWPNAGAYLSDEERHSFIPTGRPHIAETLHRIASALTETCNSLPTSLHHVPGLAVGQREMALALTGKGHDLRLTNSLTRLLSRMFGDWSPNSHFTHQTALARLVGAGKANRVYAAALEVSERYCGPKDPSCEACPVREFCLWYRKDRREGHQGEPSVKASLLDGRMSDTCGRA